MSFSFRLRGKPWEIGKKTDKLTPSAAYYQYPIAERVITMGSIHKSILKSVLFSLVVIFVLTDPVICAGKGFYSIHFATLKDFRDVNKQVNLLKEKGKVVFWEKTEIPAVGQFYRVYIGRINSWNDAVAFREKLKSSGDIGPLGIQWFNETLEPKEIDEPPKMIVSKKLAFVRPLYSDPKKDRFIDNKDGTVTDTKTKLMWIKNGWRMEFISALTWFEAMEKVKKFKHGNFKDWRLPTVEEWNSLIDTNNKNPALIEPNPFENIISHMPYWSKTEFAYDKNHISNDQSAHDSYIVTLWSGRTYHQKKTKRAFVLPVRLIETH
jgi:hypothetical protein